MLAPLRTRRFWLELVVTAAAIFVVGLMIEAFGPEVAALVGKGG